MIKALILHAPGTNRDGDLADAIRMAGAEPVIIPLSIAKENGIKFHDYGFLGLPGGFSYGDALGAGSLMALNLKTWLADELNSFVETGKPVIGICNGFQALVKAGVLPGGSQKGTLTFNKKGRFECRWVTLAPNKASRSPWLKDLPPIECPIAHGEGRFILKGENSLPDEQIALSYTHLDGTPADEIYPINPNGSPFDIAGVTNDDGNVLGLMPHPENHIYYYQHPRWTQNKNSNLGLELFKNGIRMAK